MDYMQQDILSFFDEHAVAFPLYKAFEENVLTAFPETKIRVKKTQISFANRCVYACVSFQRIRMKAELPDPYLVITLGLPYPLDSERVASKTEPYPGRWTNHIVIGKMKEIDAELMLWICQAYEFAEHK